MCGYNLDDNRCACVYGMWVPVMVFNHVGDDDDENADDVVDKVDKGTSYKLKYIWLFSVL